MASFRLNDLPTELISYIIETLRPEETNERSLKQIDTALQTWCDLRLVNRRISAITTPSLFRRVHLATQKAIIDLLHLVIVKPSILEKIHGVQIGNAHCDWKDADRYDNEISRWSETFSTGTLHPHFMNLATIKQKIAIIRSEAVRIGFDRTFSNHLACYGSWPLAVIMFLHIHHNIREFNIIYDFFRALIKFHSEENYWNKFDCSIKSTGFRNFVHGSDEYVDAYERTTTTTNGSEAENELGELANGSPSSYPCFTKISPHILSKLEVLKIRKSRIHDMLSTEMIYPFFVLPNLKTVQAEMVAYPEMGGVIDPYGYNTGIVIRPPILNGSTVDWSNPSYIGSSSVQNIELTGAVLNEKAAMMFLQLPKALRRFKIIKSTLGHNHVHVPSALLKTTLISDLDLTTLSLHFNLRCPEPLYPLTKSLVSLRYLQADLYDLLGERDKTKCSDRLISSLPQVITVLELTNETKGIDYPERPKTENCWCLAEGLFGLLNSININTFPDLRLFIIPMQLLELSENFCNKSVTVLDLENMGHKKGVNIVWSNARITYRLSRHRNNGILFHCDLED